MKPRKPIPKKSAKKLAHEFAMQGLSDMAFIAHITRNQKPIPKKRIKPRRKVNPLDAIFPNENDVKKEPVVVRVFKDGREACNQLTKAGRDEYQRRIRLMWERQGKRCCLEGRIEGCPGKLALAEATFEHQDGRGMGAGHRDDRTERVNQKTGKLEPYNGAAHFWCNSRKGSVKINYNEGLGV